MNKNQWKCTCCGKIRGIIKHANIDGICFSCFTSCSAISSIHESIDKNNIDRDVLQAENKSHKKQIFELLEKNDKLQYKCKVDLRWGLCWSFSWFIVSAVLFFKLKGWL